MDRTIYEKNGISVSIPIGVPFLHTKAIDDENVLQKQHDVAESIVKGNSEGWGSNWASSCGSWNSTEVYDNILSDVKEFNPILDNIDTYVETLANSMSINLNGENVVITESWLNANPPGNVQECHIHNFVYFSFVYYVYVPSGKFVLDNPLSFDWPPLYEDNSPYDSYHEVDVSAGDLIGFPSNAEHHTTVNTSNEYRYSIAFNVGIQTYLPQGNKDK